MKVLIIDDSSEKIGAIYNVLNEIPGFSKETTEHVLDLNSARNKLRSFYYDLLILDLNMPASIGDSPSMEAGENFVDEIMETRAIIKPTDIIILTAFEEPAQLFKQNVEHKGFIVLQFDPMSTEWKNILKSRVEYLLLCREQRQTIPRMPPCDYLLLTATPIETEAVLQLGVDWKKICISNDSSIYRYTTFESSKGPINIIHSQQLEMGMTAAASLTTKAIITFHPKCIIMTGIAAGLDNSLKLGDIIVGTDIWDYGSGKYKGEDGGNGVEKTVLHPDAKHIAPITSIIDKLISEKYDVILDQIKSNYTKHPIHENLHIHFGPIACGPAVVASESVVQIQVKAHSRKTIGLDMESYGVCFAAQHAQSQIIQSIIIKSVSDLANSNKSDDAQPYAAYTSAQFAKYLIENCL